MGQTSFVNNLRLNLAKAIAPRMPHQRQREIWPYGDGSYSGYRLYLSRKLPELRLDPYGLALAAETSVWANECIRLRAAAVARMPWAIYDANGDKLEDTPFHRMLKYMRLEYQQNFFYLWEQSLSVHGETYMEKLTNSIIPGYSTPGGLRILNTIAVDPQVQNGAIEYYQYSANGGKYRLEVDELFTHRYTSLTDDYRASAPMIRAMDGVGIKRNMQAYMRGWYDNDATPGGIVTPKQGVTTNVDWVNKIMGMWTDAFKGSNNANSTAFIPSEIDYTQFDQKMPEHQQELSDDQIQEICAAFGVPVDMVKPGGNKDPLGGGGKMDSTRAMFFESFTEPECVDIDTYINDVILPWLMPNSGATFEHDFDEIRSLIKDTKERSDKIKSEFDGGMITFNEMRTALDYEPVEGGDWYKMQPAIVIIKKEDIPNAGIILATAQAANKPPPLLPPTPPTPELPPPAENKDALQLPAAVPQQEQAVGKSAALMLDLANHPDLIRLQNMTRKYVADTPVQWSDPTKFHVTVVTMPIVTDEQVESIKGAMNDIPVPELSLKVGSLGAFHNVGEHAVHFKIRNNSALNDYQEQVYQKCVELGIPVSGYSVPDEYKPHVTMGYAQDKVSPATFYSGLAIKPTALHFGVGDEIVWQKPVGDVITPEQKKTAAKGAMLFQKDVSYISISPDPTKTCANCRWFSNQPNTAPCYLVINGGPQIIVPEGHCDRWELMPDSSVVLTFNTDISADNPNLDPSKLPLEVQQEQVKYGDWNPSMIGNVPPVKSYIEAALDELAQWEKKVKNKGVKAAFVNYLVRDRLADEIRATLKGFEDKPHMVKGVFEAAKATLVIKAIQSTRLEFEGEFDDLLNRARNDEATRQQFRSKLASLLNTYGKKAYADGLIDGGLDETELDDEDKETIAGMLADQSTYVSGISDVLFKGDGVTDNQADMKAAMWWNKSLQPFYDAGLLSADKNSLYEWTYSDTEHCDSCQKMNGQRHRLKQYHTKGIVPKADILKCGGFNCDCRLVKASGKARGNWLGAAKSEDGHEHEVAHA